MRLRGKILVAGLAPVLFLGLLEGGLLLFDVRPPDADRAPVVFVGHDFESEPVVWDDDVFWRMKPGTKTTGARDLINTEGFRGPLRPTPRPDGVRRILLLGDSCTHGTGVRLDATFGARLERWLGSGSVTASAPSTPWEVVNAGTPGFSVFQMGRLLDVLAEGHRPDVVVIYPGAWNDYVPAMDADDEELYQRLQDSRGGLGRLRMVQILRGIIAPAPDPDTARKERDDYRNRWSKAEVGPNGRRVPEPAFDRLLAGLIANVKARGARPILIVPPAPADTRVKWPTGTTYANLVRDAARDHDADVVDAPALFSASGLPDDRLFADHIHPADAGHRLIFQALARIWTQRDLPDIPPPPGDLAPRPLMDVGIRELWTDPTLDFAIQTHDGRAALPLPHRVRFEPILIPPHSSLVVALRALAAPDAPHAGHADFEIWIRPEDAAEARVVAEPVQVPTDRTGWSDPTSARVDLAPYGGQKVEIRLSARGSAHRVTWGRAAIHPFR
ncbi:MAG: hypothetical protein CMJ83_10410 [Planctomycetes bacterium]|nr:hypothetical protein [Planctomycetota bacterium]